MKKNILSDEKPFPLDYVVRLACPGDEVRVRAFGRALWFGGESQSHLDPYVSSVFAKYWDENYLRAVFAMPQAVFVLAQLQKEVIGVAMAHRKWSEPQTAQLSRLAVLPPYSGREVERALLHHCELALPRSVTTLQTGVMQDDENQLEFFISQGFKGARFVELGEGKHFNVFIEMDKPLARRAPGALSLTRLSPLPHGEPGLN